MRNVVAASLLALSAVVHTGCPGFCGGFEGGGNQVYERESEMLILCENGGFVASLSTEMIEGRTGYGATGQQIGVRGEDGQLVFDFVNNYDGTAVTPQLGDTPWTEAALDTVALDHANVLCDDLELRAWWATPAP